MGVEVGVEEDSCVGRRQVDPLPTRARGKEEDKHARIRVIKLVNPPLPLLGRHIAVDAETGVPNEGEVTLENAQHVFELRKDQHLVPKRFEAGEEEM